jgi:hypothetical protein
MSQLGHDPGPLAYGVANPGSGVSVFTDARACRLLSVNAVCAFLNGDASRAPSRLPPISGRVDVPQITQPSVHYSVFGD